MSKRRKNPSRGNVDFPAATELHHYAVNDSDLYRQQITPIILNLARKIKKGVYDEKLALKLWRYAADSAAKHYTFEHGDRSPGAYSKYQQKGYGIFNVPTREETAKSMAAWYEEELNDAVAKLGGKKNPHKRKSAKWSIDKDRGATGNFEIKLTSPVGDVQYPIRVFDGRILYDFPERVPAYVKAIVQKMYDKNNPRKRRKNPRHTKATRIVVSGNKFKVAGIMASAGIPFIFVEEAGKNTVGDVPNQHYTKLQDLFLAHPDLDARLAGHKGQLAAQRRKNPSYTIKKAPQYGYDPHKRTDRKILHQRVQKHGYESGGVHMPVRYWVRVKRGNHFVEIAGFSSKVYAVDYGTALARKFTRQAFDVYWKK